jgi:hypothetical protein
MVSDMGGELTSEIQREAGGANPQYKTARIIRRYGTTVEQPSPCFFVRRAKNVQQLFKVDRSG